MLAEVYRERTSISATLLGVFMFFFVLGIAPAVMAPVSGPMSTAEMSLTSGKGITSLLGSAAIITGVIAVGLAVTCLAAPFAAPLIISSVFGVAGTWMAGSGTLALGVGALAISGIGGIAGGIAAIGMDE